MAYQKKCRNSADGILDCRKIAEYLQKSADDLQMEFWIAEKLQNICRKSADFLQMEFWIAEKIAEKVQIVCQPTQPQAPLEALQALWGWG